MLQCGATASPTLNGEPLYAPAIVHAVPYLAAHARKTGPPPPLKRLSPFHGIRHL